MTMNAGKKPAKRGLATAYLLSLSLLLGLGGWQVRRGLEKSQVEDALSIRQDRNISLDRRLENWPDIQYKTVELRGRWLTGKSFLLDGRVYKGEVGYEWLNPIQLDGDASVILVNRGWVQKDRVLETRVVGEDPGAPVKITGQFYLPEPGFTIGPAYTDTHTWPVIVQYFDQDALSQALGVDLEPGIVVMDTNLNRGLVRIWSPYVINAMRHYGYALQWWGLALVLIVFGYVWHRKSG